MPTTQDLIGSAEACRILGVSRATLTRWAKAGRLHAIPTGTAANAALIFDRAEVERVKAEMQAAS